MFDKLKKLGRRGKAILMAACLACTCAVTSVAAFAEETTGTDTTVTETVTDTATSLDMATVIGEAGEQISGQFGDLVITVIPVIIGILGSGLVIFGIFALVKSAKKIFGKVAG